ncbi:MAG: hypothetical protein JSS61_04020 [Verrucomicrobia bacterium]|nr:hypothetical protein [Verrucomicrobiota bacterium]
MLDYNLGLIGVQACDQGLNRIDEKIQEHIEQMNAIKANCQVIDNLTNRLSHAQGNFKNFVDFSGDVETRSWIDQIHARNPAIFENGATYAFHSVQEIDTVLQGLDAQLRQDTTELNGLMTTKINPAFDDRAQLTEAMRQMQKEAADFLASINRKTRQ